MDKNTLHRLGERIVSLLEKYDVPYEVFKMTVHITPDYYRTIRENFRDEATGEILPLVQGPHWYIDLYYFEGIDNDNDFGDVDE